MRILSLLLFICACSVSCERATDTPHVFNTENVVIVIVDGARYSETWGDSTHQYIPNLDNVLAHQGVVNTAFYNLGGTWTIPGHTAIMTGHNQVISNSGQELPQYSSLFQHWIKKYNKDSTDAWIISSKDKLEVLADCQDPEWYGNYNPSTDCGINGLGSGYRHDSITFQNAINILSDHQPKLVLLNFREPDFSGHAGNWDNYLQGIIDTDQYIADLWDFIENDPNYSGSTTMFVTNDHGRHLDGISGGFTSHGDNCDGCRHITLFATGPDFKNDIIVDSERDLRDVAATTAALLGLEMPNSSGQVMIELIK